MITPLLNILQSFKKQLSNISILVESSCNILSSLFKYSNNILPLSKNVEAFEYLSKYLLLKYFI